MTKSKTPRGRRSREPKPRTQSEPSSAKRIHVKPRSLSPRKAKYLEGLTQGKSRRKAALEAGFCEYTAEHAAKELEQSPDLRAALAELMPPIDVLAKRICEGVDAIETQVFCNVMGSKLKQNQKVELTPVDLVAWTERRKYTELAMRIRGVMPGEKIEVGGEVKQRVIVEFQDVDAG